MRKKVIIVISLLVVISLALGLFIYNRKKNNDILSLILEVDSGINSVEGNLNHKIEVPNSTKYVIADTTNLPKTFKIDGVDRSIEYVETINYSKGNYIVHMYYVDGDEKCKIGIRENGELYGILYAFANIDFSVNNTIEKITNQLEAELSKWVDLNKYQYADIPTLPDDMNDYFTLSYMYYNEINGYKTDYCGVTVMNDGDVLGFRIYDKGISDYGIENIDINIDPKLEDKMIELKMKDIYDTKDSKYIRYNKSDSQSIVVYNGKLYVNYYVGVFFEDKKRGGEVASFQNDILIPLDLISYK